MFYKILFVLISIIVFFQVIPYGEKTNPVVDKTMDIEYAAMLHGWASSPQVFSKLIKTIGLHRSVIAPAMPGFGKSFSPSKPWGTWDYVDWLNQCFDLFVVTNQTTPLYQNYTLQAEKFWKMRDSKQIYKATAQAE